MPNLRFCGVLFQRVLSNIECIVCQNGQTIELPDTIRQLGKVVERTSFSAEDERVRLAAAEL